LLAPELIENGLIAARETGAAACAVPVKDTIKLADDDGYVIDTPPRSKLWSVQTPQVVRIDILRQAYDLFGVEASDDAQLVEASGFKVKLYPGDADNIKITGLSDLHLAEIILKGMKE
jgi:2-C-methyl-D-erythritol 4-phosphate cytidylyltransferase